MRQTTEFPCCVQWLSNVKVGDDGFPLAMTRDNISTWFGLYEIQMPENSDGLSDAELILKFAESLEANYRVISYADALYFSRPDAIKALKGLDLKDWDSHFAGNGCFSGPSSHYPPELRKILKEFALGQTYLDSVNLLRQAIRERDEEIARKGLAAEKAERERQEAYEKLKGFLESIGDFVILDAGGPDDGFQAVLTPIKELWIKSDGDILLLGNRGRDPFQISIVDGFDENVNKIIKWMVENGAIEPEHASR